MNIAASAEDHIHRFKMPKIDPPSGLTIYYRGRDLSEGPLPALFYFALSGEDSLNLDPFNQPVMFLLSKTDNVRVFSFTIPGHGPGLENAQAIAFWAEKISKNESILEHFFDQALQNIAYLIEEGWVDSTRISVAGLSRGGFVATHIAARDHRIKTILGFAPLTRLETADEFKKFDQSLIKPLALVEVIDQLTDKKLKFYIGNRDLRVGTEDCFQFIKDLTEQAYQKGVRSPPVELVINPSVGHKGHGTLPSVFEDGIDWLLRSNKLK
jgi:hypothetical protein